MHAIIINGLLWAPHAWTCGQVSHGLNEWNLFLDYSFNGRTESAISATADCKQHSSRRQAYRWNKLQLKPDQEKKLQWNQLIKLWINNKHVFCLLPSVMHLYLCLGNKNMNSSKRGCYSGWWRGLYPRMTYHWCPWIMDHLDFQLPYLGAFLVASTIFCIGIASPYWIFTRDVYSGGVWHECLGLTCKSLVSHVAAGKSMYHLLQPGTGISLIQMITFKGPWVSEISWKGWIIHLKNPGIVQASFYKE